MSSASDTAGPSLPPAPSVFVSYASEDRAAARTLRDTLAAAGLEVWYDEEELTGGDAWDQKIRRQIRDCDYFMPIISATTESRKEGYFRREWRLATDRSLDMADDVLFLLPVSIDGTAENGARVPDKFLAVQWLRAPGGNPTPALHHLIRRLLAGDHHVRPRGPTGATRPPMAYQQTTAPFTQPPFAEPPVLSPPPGDASAHAHLPPPMPLFPQPPEKGGFFHGIKFIAEVMWWALTVAGLLFRRLPKWGRIVVIVWLVLTLFSTRCSNSRDNNISFGDTRSPDTQKAIRTAADEIAQAARDARKNRNPADLARIGNEIAKKFSSGGPGGPEGAAFGKKLVMVPFARPTAEGPADKFASAVFASLYGQLTLAHGREVGLFRQPPADGGDESLIARAKEFGSGFILTGRPADDGQPAALTVRLLVVGDGSVKWTESFPVEGSEPTTVADQIAEHVLEVLPKR